MRRFISAVAIFRFGTTLLAQPFPSKLIEIANSFAVGGANDLNVRALQVVAERILGVPLVQTFRQGGGGVVGSTEVANVTPNGYKLLVVTSGELTAAPNLTKTTYTLDSFVFIDHISSKPYGVVAKTDSPSKDISEFLRAAKERPDKYTIGTTPTGGTFLTAKHFIIRGGVPLTRVPYGGAGPAMVGVLGGHIDSVRAPLAAAEAQIKGGALRLLAVSGSARVRGHETVPTRKEFGIEALFVQWTGIVAPRGVPADRIVFLRDALARIAKNQAYLKAAERRLSTWHISLRRSSRSRCARRTRRSRRWSRTWASRCCSEHHARLTHRRGALERSKGAAAPSSVVIVNPNWRRESDAQI